jgi:hypothetical protein
MADDAATTMVQPEREWSDVAYLTTLQHFQNAVHLNSAYLAEYYTGREAQLGQKLRHYKSKCELAEERVKEVQAVVEKQETELKNCTRQISDRVKEAEKYQYKYRAMVAHLSSLGHTGDLWDVADVQMEKAQVAQRKVRNLIAVMAMLDGDVISIAAPDNMQPAGKIAICPPDKMKWSFLKAAMEHDEQVQFTLVTDKGKYWMVLVSKHKYGAWLARYSNEDPAPSNMSAYAEFVLEKCEVTMENMPSKYDEDTDEVCMLQTPPKYDPDVEYVD